MCIRDRIWIVEDDNCIGLLIETAVRKADHTATRFDNSAALEKGLKTGLPDLLLLDLMLRGKDGFTILREWKARLATRSIPVIILSARTAANDKVHGLELGAEDYICLLYTSLAGWYNGNGEGSAENES